MEGLICEICQRIFKIDNNEPYVLPCGHTFCMLCIQSFRRCPNDRQEFTIATKNFTLINVLSGLSGFMNNQLNLLPKEANSKKKKCKQHLKRMKKFCISCQQLMCDVCICAHSTDGSKIISDENLKAIAKEKYIELAKLDMKEKEILKQLKDSKDFLALSFKKLLDTYSIECDGYSQTVKRKFDQLRGPADFDENNIDQCQDMYNNYLSYKAEREDLLQSRHDFQTHLVDFIQAFPQKIGQQRQIQQATKKQSSLDENALLQQEVALMREEIVLLQQENSNARDQGNNLTDPSLERKLEELEQNKNELIRFKKDFYTCYYAHPGSDSTRYSYWMCYRGHAVDEGAPWGSKCINCKSVKTKFWCKVCDIVICGNCSEKNVAKVYYLKKFNMQLPQ